MTHTIETEFKLRATRPLEIAAIDAVIREVGLDYRTSAPRELTDTYFEDGAGSLLAHGLGLRLREGDGVPQLACKDRGYRGNGLFVRNEFEAPWSAGAPPGHARDLPDPLRDAVEPLALDRPLAPALRLRVQRERRTLFTDDRALARLDIDHVRASANGRDVSFAEVELEVLDDLPTCEHIAQQLVRRLPLQPADDDKPSHARRQLGIEAPAVRTLAIRDTTPTGAAVQAIASRLAEQIRRHEGGVRTGLDPEAVHGMRTALRRIRCVVRAFAPLWGADDSEAILAHHKATARRLGVVRDLDVLLAEVPALRANLPSALHAAAERLVQWIGARRAIAHADLRAWLRSSTRLGETRGAEDRLLQLPDGALAATPLAASLTEHLGPAARAARQLARRIEPQLPLAAAHELRIATKRVRYLAEEFRHLDRLDCDRALATITRCADALGTLCDRERGAAQAIAWLPLAAASLGNDPEVAAVLGALATHQQAGAHRARKLAARRVAKAARKKVWSRFLAD